MWGSSHLLGIEGLPLGVSRFQVFLAIKPILKGAQYWKTLRNAYDLSDNLFIYRHDVRLAFTSKEPEREQLMSKPERDALSKLPEQVTIYRAMTEQEFISGKFGVSWTLEKKVAKFFAETYGRNLATRKHKRVIHSITINKSEVVALSRCFLNVRNQR